MKKMIPKVGTKAPMKTGGTGGGMSKAAVAKAMPKKADTKAAKPDMLRNTKMVTRRMDKAMKGV